MSRSNPLNALARGSYHGVAVNILGVALSFILHMVLARIMGIVEFGSYMYVLSWISVLVIFCALGLDGVAFRFVAAYAATQESGKLRALLVRGPQIIVVFTVVVVVVASTIVGTLPDLVPNELAPLMLSGFVLLPLWALANFNQSATASFRYPILSRLPDSIIRPSLMLAVAAILYFELGRSILAVDAISIHLSALGVSLLISSLIVKRIATKTIANVEHKFETSLWLKTAWSLMLISFVYILLGQFDIIMIGFFENSKDVGVYAVSNRISQFITFGLQAIYLTAAPMISQFFATNDRAGLDKFVRKLRTVLIYSSAPILLIVIVFGAEILALFGEEFTVGYLTLVILSIGQFSNAVIGPAGYLLTMSGNERVVLSVVTKGLALNIILNVPLIYYCGIFGAAIATCMATFLSNALMHLHAKRILNLTL